MTVVEAASSWEGVGSTLALSQFSSSGVRFLNHHDLKIESVMPSTGAADGGSLVTIAAVGIKSSSSAMCRFGGAGGVITAAANINPGALECMTPAGIVGNTTLEVSANGGQDWSASLNAWNRLVFVNVSSVRPHVLGVSGGTKVVVGGNGFDFNANIYCVVSGSVLEGSAWAHADGRVMTDSRVNCAMPSRVSGMRPVEVSLGRNSQLTHSGIQLEYVTEGRMTTISPSAGPAQGGSVITISGSEFVAGRTACRFTNSKRMIVAEVLSSIEARCVTPPGMIGNVGLEITTSYVHDSPSVPVFVGGIVYVAQSPKVKAVSATPATGALLGGTMVSVHVQNAKDGKPVLCRFSGLHGGVVDIVSSLVTDGRAKCMNMASRPGNLTLSISHNGQDFVDTPMLFRQVSRPNITSVTPSVVSAAGGAKVTISGTGFTKWDKMYCGVSQSMQSGNSWSYSVATVTKSTGAVHTMECALSSRPASFRAVEVALEPNGEMARNGAVQVEFAAYGKLFSLQPSSGSVAGGTTVTLTGEGFYPGRTVCRFGSAHVVPAEIISGAEIHCVTPPGMIGLIDINVVVADDVNVDVPYFKTFGTNQFLSLVKSVSVKNFEPRVGLQYGGQLIKLPVANFPEGNTLTCRFGYMGTHIYVESHHVKNGKAVCATPALEAGNTTVEYAFNGNDFEMLVDSYEALKFANVTMMYPTLVAARGETSVTLTGFNFGTTTNPVHSRMYCGVGSVNSENGEWMHSTAVMTSSKVAACMLPARAAGYHAVEVSLARTQQMSRSGIQVEFVREATVQFMTPSRGPTQGGTVITVTGTDFVKGQTACLFGRHHSPIMADVNSATELRCVTPVDMIGEVQVEITANYQGQPMTPSQYSRSDRHFIYDGPSSTNIVRLEPPNGPVEGTTIKLYMTHIPQGSEPYCRFENRVYVEANIGQEGEFTCGVPATSTRLNNNVSVAVASNGVDFVGIQQIFTYDPIVNVTQLMNMRRIPIQGGSIVTIEGSGFPTDRTPHLFYGPMGIARCRVSGANIMGAAGGVYAPGEVMPGGTTDTHVAATVISSTQLACAMPSRAAGYRTVEITLNNGKDFSRSGIVIEYIAPTISHIESSRAPVFGGTVITVSGHGFRKEDMEGHGGSACVFGDIVVRAEVRSTEEMLCSVPAVPAPGTVKFEITSSVDRHLTPYYRPDYTYSGLTFQYVANPMFTLSPATQSGTIAGGSRIKLFSNVLKPIVPVYCKFGNSYVLATQGNDGSAECITTAQRADTKNVSVSILYNNQELMTYGTAFEYTPEHNVTGWESQARDPLHQYQEVFVEPRAGTVRGGFVLRMRTNHPTSFVIHAKKARARFGTTVVPVRAYSEWRGRGQMSLFDYHDLVGHSIVMEARAPPTSAGFQVVEFSYNGEQFSVHGRQVEFFEAGRVESMYPLTGIPGENTVVTIQGRNFRHSGQTYCRFGSMPQVLAVFQSSQLITCVAPMSPVGPAEVSVQTAYLEPDGSTQLSEVIVEDTHRFLYMKAPEIHRIQRNAGPQNGGAMINIHGKRFQDSAMAHCRIGAITVPALRQGANRLRCYSPAHYVQEPAFAMNVTVEISFNGQDFTEQGHLYEYHKYVNVSKVYPSKGSTSGGSVVTIFGSGFVQRVARLGYFGCRFGGITVPASYVTSNAMRCNAPMAPAKFQALEVTTSSLYTHSGLQFEQMERVRTFHVAPSTGPIKGGTLVTVYGTNFNQRTSTSYLPSAACKIGHARGPATVMSTGELLCRTPEMVVGRNYITVSMNNEDQPLNALDFSQLSTVFDYTEGIRIDKFWPSSGPTIGGTDVSIMGAGFSSNPGLGCRFGVNDVDAIYNNDSMIICPTPTHMSGLVPLMVSNNGEDYAIGEPFTYYITPNVTSIYPRKGLTYGGTPVFATGFGFTNTSDLSCKFDKYDRKVVVPATFLSSSLVICLSPSHSKAMVSVEVSNNGDDFTANYQLFEYTNCPLGHYCPDFEIIPAPNGTFAGTTDLRNFTLCFPGTYQSATGQVACLPCPVGFICPDYGMYSPRVCPRGQVCDDTGLAVGGELKPCPPGHYCPLGTATADPSGYADVDAPIPCPEGMYCNFGVTTNISVALNFTTPQKCYSGFYCPAGSRAPQGAGECPPGYYCPEAIAIACPPGTFCKGFGNSQPKECQPGTYNPNIAQAECKMSEAGTISPGFGRLLPAPCPAGYVCNTTAGALPASRCPKGFFCLIGTVTSNASSPEGGTPDEAIKQWRSKRPYPCPPGTYCLDGVNTPYSKKGDLVTPQPCTPGAFCVNATKDATGETCARYEYGSPEDFRKQTWTTINPRPDGTSEIVVIVDDECGGPCPPGHYCPVNSSIPTPAPKGTFSKGFGNVQATLCFAGTFAPNRGSSACLPCPAGYQCPKDGVWQPTICPPGRYRSLDDTITCQMCPPGTWSAKYGVSDQTFCEACPAGRVCSLEAMTSLAQSNPCPQGFVCDTYTFQATARCHAGFWCDYGTTPARQFDHLCPKGFYCLEGTSKNQRFRNACPQNFYCPAGTNTERPYETQCPKGTQSNQGSYLLENCTRICEDPDDNPTLLSTTNALGCLVNIVSPIHPNSTAKSNSTTQTLFKLRGLEYLRYTIDLTGLDRSMIYSEHWRMSIYSNDSFKPLPHTKWFMNTLNYKHQVNDFGVMARTEEMTVRIQLELLHGLYEVFINGVSGWQWNDTLKAEILRPHRADFGITKSFLALVENSADNALPQNLPKMWGDALPNQDPDTRKENLVYYDYLGANESVPMIHDDFNEYVATPELFWNKQMDGAKLVPLPYVPFFSQCRGYGSHIPVFELLENRHGCDLVPPEETVFIHKWDPFTPAAVADACNWTVSCAYEEKVDAADVRNRWYEIDIDETLFTLTSESFDFQNLQDGPGQYEGFIGTVSAVPVNVGEAGGGGGILPRAVGLSISFFQKSPTKKILIEAEIEMGDSEVVNKTRLGTAIQPIAAFQDGTLDYEFNIQTQAMGFGELINAFAFEADFFMILFFIIALGSVGIVSLFWTVQRLCTRLANPPKFRFWAYMRVLAPNPFKGIFLASCIIWTAVIMVWMLFRPYGLNFLDSHQIIYDGKADLTDSDTLQINRAGRTGLAFTVLGFIMMWEGSKAFIPLPEFETYEILDEDEEEEMFDDMGSSSEDEEVDDIPTDDDLLPEEMRRSHLMFAGIMEMSFLLLVVEFSYSSTFGDQIWLCLVCLKVIQMMFEQILCNYIKDVLLLCPLMVGLEMTQFIVTMGADGFIDFLMSYCVELVLVLAERVYLDPAIKAVSSVFPYIQVFFLRRYVDIRQKILDPEGLEDKEEIPDPEDPEENVIEDLIDAFQVYANETTAACLAPFIILWMLVFSKELNLVDTYGIRDSDLVYYVLFAIVIVPTQMCMDVFIQNSQELFHGWKIYEYLRYAQQRFINRTERWKLKEKEQDESIDKNLRAVDQVCFSTQFYFINALHSTGLVFVIFAIEMMILAQYNMFGDPMFAGCAGYIGAVAYGIKFLAFQISDFIGLWIIIKPPEEDKSSLAASMRSASGSASGGTKGSGSFGSASGSRSKKSKGDTGGVTTRMRSQDLMHAFLEQNRPWMLQNLANIFTSEFLARNPPWVVRDLAKVFGVTPGFGTGAEPEEDAPLGKTTVAADISSDEGSDASEEAADYGNMDHLLTNAVHKVALRWLSYVRKEEASKFNISSDSEDSEEDGNYEPAMLTDGTRDIAETWLRKVAKYLRDQRALLGKADLAAEISSDSTTDSDEGGFGHMETFNEVTTAIAIKWLEKIRGKPHLQDERGLRADISSDDSDEEDDGPVAVEYEMGEMNEKTTQIAFRWLRHVRAKRRPLVRVDISSDSEDGDDGELAAVGASISSDDSDDEDGPVGATNELQEPSTKAVAYKWLGKVRKAEVKQAWEDDTSIVEDVAPKERMERKKPKAKKKK
jgi:hypothetical protein